MDLERGRKEKRPELGSSRSQTSAKNRQRAAKPRGTAQPARLEDRRKRRAGRGGEEYRIL